MFQSLLRLAKRVYRRTAASVPGIPGRETRRRWKFRMRLLSLVPPLTGFVVLFLLAGVPQLREVYLGIIADADVLRGALGFVLLVLLCAMLYVWHYWVSNVALDNVYPEHADVHFDVELMRWRDVKALLCASLPLVGLIIGLFLLRQQMQSLATIFDVIADRFKVSADVPLADDFRPTRRLLTSANIYVTLLLTALGLAAVALAAMWVYLRRTQRGHIWRLRVSGMAGALTLAAALLPLLVPDAVVPVTRAIGPLATIMIALLAVISTMAFLSWVVKSLDPAITKGLSAVAAIALGSYLLSALVGPSNAPRAAAGTPQSKPDDAAMRTAFRDWLNSRRDKAAFAGKPYPVFVFAAQGGGIYATSSALGFLAALQDSCDNFAEHVFAVSAVSGGAVGAAVFTGLMQGERHPPKPCGDSGLRRLERWQQPLTQRADAIVLDDHLSPVVSLIAPDLIRKATDLVWPDRRNFDRSNALERSVACSFDATVSHGNLSQSETSVIPSLCGSTALGQGLRASYANMWSRWSTAPALVLNATWAEMGYRVAFAPFPLHAIGDGTLFGFEELLPPKTGVPTFSLIEAAFVSARFPGIVPARVVEPRIEDTRPVWNLVDGGYADNSGATTALEIYKLIEDMLVREPLLNVEPYLVLLTDAETNLVYSDITGSRLSDTIVPMEALLNVRRRLAQRAVTQAIEYIAKSRGPLSDRVGGPQSRIMIVDVEQQTFRLPLGWKISSVTNDVVRLMMGRPDLCPGEVRGEAAPPRLIPSLIRTIERNSCVKRRIATLLQGGAPQK